MWWSVPRALSCEDLRTWLNSAPFPLLCHFISNASSTENVSWHYWQNRLLALIFRLSFLPHYYFVFRFTFFLFYLIFFIRLDWTDVFTDEVMRFSPLHATLSQVGPLPSCLSVSQLAFPQQLYWQANKRNVAFLSRNYLRCCDDFANLAGGFADAFYRPFCQQCWE